MHDNSDYRELPPGVTAIVPAHNEEGGVAEVVTRLRESLARLAGEYCEVLVVDDGSTDKTAKAAADAGARVVIHKVNLGYGAALKTGLRAAKFETIVITDADGTYPVESIADLLPELEHCDMVVGSRQGAKVHIPMERRPAKWVLKVTAEFLAGRSIPDLNSGLRAFRRSDAMKFMSLYPGGFSFTTTITLAYLSQDLLVHYVAIDYHPRVGKSKLRPIRDTKNLFLTVVRSILVFNPLRVCVPFALLLFLLALYVAMFLRDPEGRIFDGTITILVTSGLQIMIVGFLADMLVRLRN